MKVKLTSNDKVFCLVLTPNQGSSKTKQLAILPLKSLVLDVLEAAHYSACIMTFVKGGSLKEETLDDAEKNDEHIEKEVQKEEELTEKEVSDSEEKSTKGRRRKP